MLRISCSPLRIRRGRRGVVRDMASFWDQSPLRPMQTGRLARTISAINSSCGGFYVSVPTQDARVTNSGQISSTYSRRSVCVIMHSCAAAWHLALFSRLLFDSEALRNRYGNNSGDEGSSAVGAFRRPPCDKLEVCSWQRSRLQLQSCSALRSRQRPRHPSIVAHRMLIRRFITWMLTVSPLVPLVCRLTPLVGQGRMTGDELDSSIIRENEPAMSAVVDIEPRLPDVRFTPESRHSSELPCR